MERIDGLRWRKSSYSGNGGADCVEVGDHSECSRVLVRDTKDRTGPMLRFSTETWDRFANQVKRSLRRCAVRRGVAGDPSWSRRVLEVIAQRTEVYAQQFVVSGREFLQ